MKSKLPKLIFALALPLLVGLLGGLATQSSIDSWYSQLNRPSIAPPNWVFGPVWTMLYILMGISFYRILLLPPAENKRRAVRVFYIQLVLNLAWSFLFFYFHNPGAALLEISLLWVSILYMIVAFYKAHRNAAYLNLPYILWVSFATVLNFYFWKLNS